MRNKVIIIGAGAAGLSAALELAKNNISSIIISDMPSERAQSVMAEGGINAAMDTHNDSPELHARETFAAGKDIADMNAIKNMTKTAPSIIQMLFEKGMSFTLNDSGVLDVRAFGGQSVKRTFYAASNTGKQLMYTLIDQTRRYEAEGLVERMTGWRFLRLIYSGNHAYGCELINCITNEKKILYGKVIIASGGLGGLFGNSTGSVRNIGTVTANLFASGVRFANGEFIQYHPTTARLHGKNMLITEAVRGEGGRLFVMRDNKPYYFMEEKYPKQGNLMPRDVIAYEEWILMQEGYRIYLTMQHLDRKTQTEKLQGVAEDCIRFLGIDPTKEPIPVEPGIHYFMGGIWVDINHRTSMNSLYAAGECACQYHGANRLGGNSLLGAIYGGYVAARSAISDKNIEIAEQIKMHDYKINPKVFDRNLIRLQEILRKGLGIVRDESTLSLAAKEIDRLIESVKKELDEPLIECCLLGKAMLMSASARKESRGAHTRSDFPKENTDYQKQTSAEYTNGQIRISFKKAGETHAD